MVPQSSAAHGNRMDIPAVQFLSAHQGLSRTYTLGPMEPNYGAYFGVASIDHNVVPVPKLWADYVEHNLLSGSSRRDSNVPFYSSMTFWPGLMPDGEAEGSLSQNLFNYLDLGVRYVITKPGRSPMPTTFLPPLDVSNQPGESGGRSVTPRLEMLFAAMERCRSIANNPTKPALERLMAKAILRIVHSIVGSPIGDDIRKDETIGISGTDYLMLQSGESAKMSVSPPPSAPADTPITSVGVTVSNRGTSADGYLKVEICIGVVCRSGRRALAGSTDNAVFPILLDEPLASPAAAPLHLTLTHQDGSRPVGLRLVPDKSQEIEGTNGALPGHTLELAFEYGIAMRGVRKVYADSVMDIWELPNPAPYFQVIQGGPCTLLNAQREDVSAECLSPATLLRRELYMPGWRVALNGRAAEAVQQDGIFQSAALPVGRSQLRYHFVPPYVEFSWAASVLGMTGLIWQIILIRRSREQQF
jgi:hypothetical protein